MIIVCPECKARLKLPDDKMKPGGVRLKCVNCGAVFTQTAEVAQEPPAPPAARPAVNKVPAPVTSPRSNSGEAQDSPAKSSPRPSAAETPVDVKRGLRERGPDKEPQGPSAEDMAKAQECMSSRP